MNLSLGNVLIIPPILREEKKILSKRKNFCLVLLTVFHNMMDVIDHLIHRHLLICPQHCNELFLISAQLANTIRIDKRLFGTPFSICQEQGLIFVFIGVKEADGRSADSGDLPQGHRIRRSLSGFVIGVSSTVYIQSIRDILLGIPCLKTSLPKPLCQKVIGSLKMIRHEHSPAYCSFANRLLRGALFKVCPIFRLS